MNQISEKDINGVLVYTKDFKRELAIKKKAVMTKFKSAMKK